MLTIQSTTHHITTEVDGWKFKAEVWIQDGSVVVEKLKCTDPRWTEYQHYLRKGVRDEAIELIYNHFKR